MPDPFDLTSLLEHWPWTPDQIDVRCVTFPDGRDVLQVRIELGLMQMELHGRPDGTRPQGWATHLERIQKTPGTMPEGMTLPDADVEALQAEAAQVARRCAVLHLLDMHAVLVQDTQDNLSRIDLCTRLAPNHAVTALLAQMRPDMISLHARARASIASAGGDTAAARAAILSGLHALGDHLPESGFHDQPSVQMLQSLQDALTPRLPASQRVELQTRLQLAIDCENFELAAILRDELRQLPD
ncbi:MAG: UvrB/UvrC motif-containing protein [Phycisphaerales bacterium]|nr:UvrB/UvrC motif-containing protein [Phycisphaerales bacterium]